MDKTKPFYSFKQMCSEFQGKIQTMWPPEKSC